MSEQHCSAESELRKCKELIEDVTSHVLSTTKALERLPETLRSDFEGDIRWQALNELYASFSKLYRAEQHAHRALCTPPEDVRAALEAIEDEVPED